MREPGHRVTIKSVVAAGKAAGHSVDTIAKAVCAAFPGSKASERPEYYVKYYLKELGQTVTEKVAASTWRKPEAQPKKEKVVLPNMEEIIGYAEYGDKETSRFVLVPLYRSHLSTCTRARMKLTDRQVITAYEHMTDSRISLDASMRALREAVVGDIQNQWFHAAGQSLPPRVEANQAQRLEDAKMAKKTEGKEEKAATERVTVKSVITAGLLAGRPDEEIAADIVENFPDTAAARESTKHISFYRHHLVKAGELEKQPRKSRKAAEPVVEAPKAKAKKAAAKAPAKAATKAKGKKGK